MFHSPKNMWTEMLYLISLLQIHRLGHLVLDWEKVGSV